MKKSKVIFPVIFLLLLVVIIWKFSNFRVNVKEVHITYPPYLDRLDVFSVWCAGIIIPFEEREVYSEITGVVDNILIKEGDKVKKGQILALIRNPDISKELIDTETQLNEEEANLSKLLKTQEIEKQKSRAQVIQSEISVEDAKTYLQQMENEARMAEKKDQSSIDSAITALQEAENSLQTLKEDLNSQYASVALKVKVAEMSQKQAENDMNRLKELFQAKIVSQKSMEDALDAYERSRLAYDFAVEELENLKARNEQDLEAARLKVEECKSLLESARKQALLNEELNKEKIKQAQIKLEKYKESLQLSDSGNTISLEINMARGKLSLLRKKFLETQKKSLSLQILSPIEGQIALIDKEIKLGKQVSPGTRLFIVSDLSHFKIKASINQSDISSIKKGQEVRIYGSGIDRWNAITGKVFSIAPMGQPGQRENEKKVNFEVFIDFDTVWYSISDDTVRKLKKHIPENKIPENKLDLLTGWMEITDLTLKRVKNKIPPDKFEAIKSLKNRKFLNSKDELAKTFKELNLSSEEISIVSYESICYKPILYSKCSESELIKKLEDQNFKKDEIQVILKFAFHSVDLRAGMSMDLEFVTDFKENVQVVPPRSIIREGDKTYVFLYEKGKAKKTEVETGLSNMFYIEICGGLSNNSEIIWDWQGNLSDGDSVKQRKIGY
ncbi:MAG TPA: HlyD family efflux transporter periplasmic adaptor subunit [Candidatus Eremiobacteraeota bacterium]|nr:MAG: putative efflux pump membrane fusion protein [bacterium ADurb.Bin363]HPZ07243.1 HlyD family efflux transporter periplasmic adaptor subunit [Candidatus Eremiobacteraeota bacterium]